MGRALLRSLQAVGAGIRTGWLILGITLILIITGEVGLRLALETRDRFMLLDRQPPTEGKGDRPAPGAAYQGAEWLPEYLEEIGKVKPSLTWHPYVYWRHTPRQGRYLNVNRKGLRVTWNPPLRDAAADPPPVRVFTFGGSTMWGYSVRDDYTVASHLSKLLYERGYRVEVTNYGETAYVSTQEVIALLRCIHRGEVADIALFYDGINDVYSPYLNDVYSSPRNKEAGIPWHEWRRREEFNLTHRPWQQLRLLLSGSFRGLRRFTTGLRRRITNIDPNPWRQSHPLSDELARQTVRVYESNLVTVEALGRHYGFEPLFYWQPVLFSKRHRSPAEQASFEQLGRFPDIGKWFDNIYRRVRRSEVLHGNPRFRNISALFDNSEEPYYTDAFHLSEPGNRLVAAAMVDDVIELIERHRAPANAVVAR